MEDPAPKGSTPDLRLTLFPFVNVAAIDREPRHVTMLANSVSPIHLRPSFVYTRLVRFADDCPQRQIHCTLAFEKRRLEQGVKIDGFDDADQLVVTTVARVGALSKRLKALLTQSQIGRPQPSTQEPQ
jgi:hypothetical protein